MSFNIGRILAEKDLRHLSIAGNQTTEGMNDLKRHLIIEMEGEKGSERKIDVERDQEGFEEIKALAAILA
jgi:hypothetical protein